MQYYTNVGKVGNSIYHRYVKDGKRYSEVVKEFAYELFFEGKQQDSWSIDGKPLTRISFNTINEMADWIKQNTGFIKIHGNQSPVHQFIAKTYPGEIHADDSYVVLNFDIEVEHNVTKLDETGTLIEIGFPHADLAQGEVISVSAEVFGTGKNYTFGTKHFNPTEEDVANGIEYIHCQDEKDLLIRFLQYWKEVNADFLVGWNITGFDIPYIVNRMNKILGEKITRQLSPFHNNTSHIFREFNINEKSKGYKILGLTDLDYLELYKKYSTSKQESYRLDHIAEVELEQNKVEYSEYGDLMDLFVGNVTSPVFDIPREELSEVQRYERCRRILQQEIETISN